MTATSPPAPQGRAYDPRDVITHDAYRLSPDLLGTPLARPWRRGAAMAVDGVLIAVLSSTPSVVFGLVAVIVLFRISARPDPAAGYIRRSVRMALRVWGALILFIVVLSMVGRVQDWMDDDERAASGAPRAAVRTTSPGVSLSGQAGMDVAALLATRSESDARARIERLVPELRRSGMTNTEIRETLTGVASIPGRPWMPALVDSALAAARPDEPEDVAESSVLVAYASAVQEGDTARARELAPRAGSLLAADTIAALRQDVRALERRSARLNQRVETLEDRLEQGPGLMARLRALSDDLGLGFGWSALYFTGFLALWQGRTPGKRLLGLRVIRLDGAPIGWWAAFERFGGYAAGVATGLLGFAQIFWDRNRQAVHDKICETVVVRTGP